MASLQRRRIVDFQSIWTLFSDSLHRFRDDAEASKTAWMKSTRRFTSLAREWARR
jgi:hypothetical protein